MKFLSLICIMVVLVLSFVPCADVYDREQVQQTLLTVAGHQDVTAQADECTPFCHCSCCASTVVVNLVASPAVPSKINTTSDIPYVSAGFLDVDLPIFQPPKLI